MTERVWHKGPPPSIGWWPASINRDRNILRWWNGKWWSFSCYETSTLKKVEVCTKCQAFYQDEIEWTKRPAWWPKRSRT